MRVLYIVFISAGCWIALVGATPIVVRMWGKGFLGGWETHTYTYVNGVHTHTHSESLKVQGHSWTKDREKYAFLYNFCGCFADFSLLVRFFGDCFFISLFLLFLVSFCWLFWLFLLAHLWLLLV